ncbi:MAG: hypothetical protein KQH79_00205 [Bacteroidetes bacterium]|nr:hypothetical protein [Bacteroidota bacterium]
MKISQYYIILFLIIMAIWSCTDDHCNADTESLLDATLTVTDETLNDINFVENLSIYSPEWSDSIYYSESGDDNVLGFVLSPFSDTTEIVFTSKDAPLNDTLFVYYQRDYTFFSQECGFVPNFEIDTIFHSYNYIDSVEIINKEISVDKNGKIQIYF